MKKQIYLFLVCLLGLNCSLQAQVNASTDITWVFNSGAAGQTAAYTSGTQDYFGQDYVTVGSGLAYYGKSTVFSTTFTLIQPTQNNSSGTDNDYICFVIKPKTGLKFTPANVAFDCVRFGTDGGKVNVKWKSSNGNITTIETGMSPNRNNSAGATQYNADLSSLSITDSDGECMLMLQLYSLGDTKQVGFANVKISGTVTGELANIETYTLQTATSPIGAGSVTSPSGSEFDEDTQITLTATANFGYRFSKWIDGEGNDVSTANPYVFILYAA